jgi:hypothetical protein
VSRYANYDALIDDIASELGDAEGAFDTLLLNLLKSVVDALNLRRMESREASGDITLAANDYDYTISSSLSDFVELIDRKTSLRLSGGTLIPLAENRTQFYKGWSPTLQTGTPSLALIFGGVLYLRSTPSAADTLTVYYYKRLATPATGGTVLIPDEYITLARARVMKRFETYSEGADPGAKRAAFSEIEADVLRAIDQDFSNRTLPPSVVVDDDDDDL